jgi:hypothetical protein
MQGAHAGRPRPDACARAVREGLAVLVLGTTLLVAGACSSHSAPEPVPGPNQPSALSDPPGPSTATASPTAGSTDPTTGPTTDPQDEPSPTGSASRPPDPAAPATVRPVERPGPTGTKVALQGTTRSRATWRDGVELDVADVRRSTTSGRGRGSMPGTPQTTFTLTLKNRSDRAVDVSRVVLTLPYGAGSRRLAQRVYDDATDDFSGVVERGASQRAVYAYALPSDRSSADLVVDLDGTHALATLKGVAR